MKVSRNDLIWCIIVSVIYILWVIWLGNYWWLFGLPIIFDIYISKKVNWTFWKKRDGNNSKFIEWLDALIFAVIAVTLINIFLFQNYKIPTGSMEKTMLIGDHLYVSKVAYGPRVPNTPLAFPFTQNTLPLTKGTKSYLEWIKLPYNRLAGFGKIKRDDIVVFNFPAGDTVVLGHTNVSYYSIVRDSVQYLKNRDIINGVQPRSEKEYYALARRGVWENFEILVRPVDRRDNYIKRCVAIPGDTMRIINRQVYVNGKPEKDFSGIQFGYYIYLNEGQTISDQVFNRMGIYDYQRGYTGSAIHAFLTQEEVGLIQKFSNVREIQLNHYFDDYNIDYFPHDTNYRWTLNNFGPLYVPKKGATIEITPENLCLYERIINYYEGNDLRIENGQIYINGQPAREYTFKMDYYWMMGDNRHSSLDSRFWGFVPEDHIVGKPRFVWLSLDNNQKFLKRIRLNRMFRKIE
ncbi:MAG: signal peptidase I [Bacteroidales bacterium]|nr:signal peptidase I [Bacteroidales bacterium]